LGSLPGLAHPSLFVRRAACTDPWRSARRVLDAELIVPHSRTPGRY
jgi:hypothetical protein